MRGAFRLLLSPDVPVEKLHSEEAREQARLVVTKVRDCHVEDIKAKLQLNNDKKRRVALNPDRVRNTNVGVVDARALLYHRRDSVGGI